MSEVKVDVKNTKVVLITHHQKLDLIGLYHRLYDTTSPETKDVNTPNSRISLTYLPGNLSIIKTRNKVHINTIKHKIANFWGFTM